MHRLILLGLACGCLLFGSGCRTSFHPPEADKRYSIQVLGPDSFRLHYIGKSLATQERIVDFALLRICHLAKERDYRYFALVDESSSPNERVVYNNEPNDLLRRPYSTLAIKGFVFRPKGIFVFNAGALEEIIRHRYRAGERFASS